MDNIYQFIKNINLIIKIKILKLLSIKFNLKKEIYNNFADTRVDIKGEYHKIDFINNKKEKINIFYLFFI